MVALYALTSVCLVLLVGLGVLVALRLRGGAERLLGERLARQVVVTQSDGQSFAGLVAGHDAGWLLLREAEQFGPQGSRVAVDGELLIPRDRISFIQKP
jgi:hypothetical protein